MINLSSFKKGTSQIGTETLFAIPTQIARIIILEFDTYYQIDAIYNDSSKDINYEVTTINGKPTAHYSYSLSTSEKSFTIPFYSQTITLNVPVAEVSSLVKISNNIINRNYPVALNKNFFNLPTLPQ